MATIPEILSGSYWLKKLLPPKDSHAMAKGIISLLKDKNKAKKMGLNARKRVEKDFTVEEMVAQTEAVYKELAEK